jgi:hypothetical protein
MNEYNRALPSKGGRNAQPGTKSDIISSNALKTMPFMGNFTEEQICDSIYKLRVENKEIKFVKPGNFSGR